MAEEDNGSTGSGGNGSTIQSSTAASMRGASMSHWVDPFGGGPTGPAPF